MFRVLLIALSLSGVCHADLIELGVHGTVTRLSEKVGPQASWQQVDKLNAHPLRYPYADVNVGDQLSLTYYFYSDARHAFGGAPVFAPGERDLSLTWYNSDSVVIDMHDEQYTIWGAQLMLWMPYDSPTWVRPWFQASELVGNNAWIEKMHIWFDGYTDRIQHPYELTSDIQADWFVDPWMLMHVDGVRSMRSSVDEITWAEYPMGDSNLDGVFNQLDIVQVLQAGKYSHFTDRDKPATWAEGDWNGYWEFGHNDIIDVLQANTYRAGPLAAKTVPEPRTAVLAAFAVLLCVCSLRGPRGRTCPRGRS
jgi:hypothetical protein